ncbi:MAG: substrate-binding domain-containing protein [Oscillospiraceae bacterium]|nr:substrate-binding domain-containing protein [Oscillospiraceae bacterium]
MTKGKIAVLIPAVYDKLDKEFVSGIYQTLKENSFDTLVFTSVSTENTDGYMCGENNIYNLPFLSDVDGIIMASNRFYDNSLKESILKQLEKCKLPCILVEEESEKIKGVFLDQKKSIYDITEHLITVHNYENIICLTGPCENKEAQKRAEGYICAMEKHKKSKNSKVIYGDFWHNSAIRLAERIASGEVSRPDAIVCTNDIMAISLCNELPKHNIKVPDDIAITGYDGSIYTLITKPAITTVCGGDLCLGKMSVKALFEIMGIDNSILNVIE